MLILGINGAYKTDGIVATLLRESLNAAVAEGAIFGKEVKTDTFHLGPLTETLHNGEFDIPPWIEPIFERMRKADGFIFASPVQGYSVSAQMSNFLDYLYSLERQYFRPGEQIDTSHELDGKVYGLITHGRADSAMKAALDMVGPLTDAGLQLTSHGIFPQIEGAKDLEENEWMRTDHKLVGQNIVRTILRLSGEIVDVNSWQLR